MESPTRGVYLDNAATTYPKPEAVYRAVESFMREVGGSAGRSGHRRAVETGRIVFEARESLARLFDAGDPLRIAFTKNATEALNVAIRGLLEPGDHVVTTSMEHNSVMRPLEAALQAGVTYSVARCAPDGTLDPAAIAAEMNPDTAMVVLTGASNVTGTLMPVAEVGELARSRGALLVVDAAQTAGRFPIGVEGDGIDVLAFTGHKELFGPQGTGGVFVRAGIKVRPLICGGTGSRSSSIEQPGEMPDVLEGGTLNAHGIAGLGAGVRFIEEQTVAAARSHELELIGRITEGIARVPGAKLHGPTAPERRVGILPLTFDRFSPPQVAELLDARYGIATRAGLHCSPMAHRTMGTIDTGVLRVSLSFMNTAEDVDYLLEALAEIIVSA